MLEGVSVELRPGITGLLGANGAGKTTLLDILSTLRPPDAGEVRWQGQPVSGEREARRVRRRLAYLPQAFDFPRSFSVGDAIAYAAWLRHVEAGLDIAAMLRLVGLEDDERRPDPKNRRNSMKRRSRSLAIVGLLAVPAILATNFQDAEALQTTPSLTANENENEIKEYLEEHPEAERLSEFQVAFNDGAVIMNFVPEGETRIANAISGEPSHATSIDVASAASTSYVEGCPAGNSTRWYCFYEHASWKGRMLQFKDCNGLLGVKQNFGDYGFARMTSSWVNTKTSRGVDVFSNPNWTGMLWTSHAGAKSSNVGAANNDRAVTFTAYC
ncbi:MAG: ATP-binding cassette domain-containing protein [Dermatophilus congolensis]|nr:ATP-binding cassette domain-containing protein [Dermatophilus congolensis]